MAASKKEVLPTIEKTIEELNKELQKIKADLEYFKFIDKKDLTPEDKEEIEELNASKDTVEAKMKLLLMALQKPIYDRIANLSDKEKEEIVKKEQDRLKKIRDKKLGESLLITPPAKPEKPADFMSWDDDRKREFVKSSEAIRKQGIQEADAQKAAIAKEVEGIDAEISKLLTESGKQACIDKYLQSKGFVLKEFTKDEMQGVFGSLDLLPNGISLRVAQYLCRNPYVAKEIIKSYRDLKTTTIESPGLDFATAGFYLGRIFPMGEVRLNDQGIISDMLGIKPAHSYGEIQERYNGKDANIAMLTAKKDEALREFDEVRTFVKNKELKRQIPDFKAEDMFYGDSEKRRSKATEFLTLVAEVKAKEKYTLEALGVPELVYKDFKDCRGPGLETIETRFLDLQKRFEQAKKKRIEFSYTRESRLDALEKEYDAIIQDFRYYYYDLYEILFQQVLKPKIEATQLGQADTVLRGRGVPVDSPGLYSTIYNEGEIGEDYYKKYIESINSSFSRGITELNNLYDADLQKGKAAYESNLAPIEDAIVERISPVIGQASREQIIEVGLRSINGVWKGVYERSMPTEKPINNEPVDIPEVVVSPQDLELARRRAALAALYAERNPLSDEVRSYIDGTVVALAADEKPKTK